MDGAPRVGRRFHPWLARRGRSRHARDLAERPPGEDRLDVARGQVAHVVHAQHDDGVIVAELVVLAPLENRLQTDGHEAARLGARLGGHDDGEQQVRVPFEQRGVGDQRTDRGCGGERAALLEPDVASHRDRPDEDVLLEVDQQDITVGGGGGGELVALDHSTAPRGLQRQLEVAVAGGPQRPTGERHKLAQGDRAAPFGQLVDPGPFDLSGDGDRGADGRHDHAIAILDPHVATEAPREQEIITVEPEGGIAAHDANAPE